MRRLFARFARGASCMLAFRCAQRGRATRNPAASARMPYRRTIRKPTRWTPEEWSQIEEAARERGVPPIRYVREAALAAKLPPLTMSRVHAYQGAYELVRQLKRLLNNLNQLLHLAEDDGAEAQVFALKSVIATTEAAVPAAAAFRGKTDALVAAVVEAGTALNDTARGGNTIRELPPEEELGVALCGIILAVQKVQRA